MALEDRLSGHNDVPAVAGPARAGPARAQLNRPPRSAVRPTGLLGSLVASTTAIDEQVIDQPHRIVAAIRRDGPLLTIEVTPKDALSNDRYDFHVTVMGRSDQHFQVRNGKPITKSEIRLADLNSDGILDIMIVGGTDHRAGAAFADGGAAFLGATWLTGAIFVDVAVAVIIVTIAEIDIVTIVITVIINISQTDANIINMTITETIAVIINIRNTVTEICGIGITNSI